MTYSQLTKVRGFLPLMFVLILISACAKYNPEKHQCIDYACGYFNPFGEDTPQFRISQVINWSNSDFINWTDKTKCPPVSGEYCYRDVCTPNPLTIEECVEWIDKNDTRGEES